MPPETCRCTPTDAPAMGPPPKPSVSGFGGERTSKGAGEVFAVLLAETKPSGLCEDDWGFSGGGKPGEWAALWHTRFGLTPPERLFAYFYPHKKFWLFARAKVGRPTGETGRGTRGGPPSALRGETRNSP